MRSAIGFTFCLCLSWRRAEPCRCDRRRPDQSHSPSSPNSSSITLIAVVAGPTVDQRRGNPHQSPRGRIPSYSRHVPSAHNIPLASTSSAPIHRPSPPCRAHHRLRRSPRSLEVVSRSLPSHNSSISRTRRPSGGHRAKTPPYTAGRAGQGHHLNQAILLFVRHLAPPAHPPDHYRIPS